MKKWLSILLAAVLMLGALCGCAAEQSAADGAQAGTDGQENVSTQTNPAQDSQESQGATGLSGSITLMASQNWIKDVDRELFKQFEAETGVEVKVLLTPDNGYATLLGTSLSGGSNAVDIFMYAAGGEMRSAGISEVALDLSNEPWADRMEDWAVSANTEDGKLLGFSTWGVDYEGVLYNRSLFEEKGWEVPATWADFLALCDTIQADGITPLYESINGTWHTQSWFYGLSPAILAEKPDVIDYLNSGKDSKWSDIQAAGAGLAQIRQLLSYEPKYYTNDGQSEDWFGSYPALQNRECAMMFTYSAYAAELAANGSTDTWGMFPVPLLDNTVGVSNGGGYSKYINKNSQNIDACKALLEFLARDENLETYYAARTDLVTSAFRDVESVAATTATTEMEERSTETPVIMLMKDVLYWDPDQYMYMQGFANDGTSVEDYLNGMDAYRATMFDTAEE
ncbi:MAG: extracellular solute-binding protein [Oscillospiraceae bacterium]|nr:extracellular solute-binding protein [Oscillospiraceae bacterium]